MNPTPKEQTAIFIRWMIRRDMPEVMQIERDSFETAWTEENFLGCLRQKTSIGMVAEHGEKIVGYMVYELRKDNLRILNFAASPNQRRCGVGSQMINKLKGKLCHWRARLMVPVRETNLAAQLFFRSQRFEAVKILRNYYQDGTEDAYLMRFLWEPQLEFMEKM